MSDQDNLTSVQDPRSRITRGFNRSRLRMEARRARGPVAVLLVGVAVAVIGAAYLVTQLTTTLFRSTREVRVMVDDAYGVKAHISDIRYRGIRAGTVTKVQRQGDKLVLVAHIADKYPTIYKDATAQLRPATPLQDVNLDITDPGHASAGKLGSSVLPDSQVQGSVDIDDVLSTLNADTRTRLKELLDNLGNGLQDRGAALRAAIVQVSPLVKSAADITGALAQNKQQTARLVHNAAVLTNELGTRNTELRRLVREGAATFGTLQAGSPDLDATLRALPSTLGSINSSFAALNGVVDRVDGAVNGLKPVADRLPDTLSSVRELNGTLAPAVGSLRTPVKRLVPLSNSLAPVGKDLESSARALRSSVPALDKTTNTGVKCEQPIIDFFQWNTSLTKFGELRGPIPRGNLAIAPPDTGVSKVTRTPGLNCSGGTTIGGRPATRGDDG